LSDCSQCCFSELAQYESNYKPICVVQSENSRRLFEMYSLFSSWYSWGWGWGGGGGEAHCGVKQPLTHSLVEQKTSLLTAICLLLLI